MKTGVKIFAVAAVLAVAAMCISRKFCGIALTKNHTFGKKGNSLHSKTENELMRKLRERRDEYKGWYECNSEDLFLLNSGGVKIHASEIILKEKSHKYAILCHGYNDDNSAMAYQAHRFFEMGYNIIAPDARASGRTEGQYVGMGWLERNDIKGFVNLILAKDVQAEIVLFGMSMGAAEVMMAAGDELPDNIKCIIEDCGFTSVWDIFGNVLKRVFKLPIFPVLPMVSAYSKLFIGYSFGEASALEAVKRSKIPLLIIHGDCDDFIPCEMAYRLYDAAAGDKEIFIVKGAGHILSDIVDNDGYWNKVQEFTQRYTK